MSVENPPGWHPDPVGRHEHRYWDGTQWTDHVADGGNMSTDPLQAAPPQEAAPIGPSMVNLPAINPADLQVSLAQPVQPAAEPTPAAAAPPPTQDYAQAGDTAVAAPPAADVAAPQVVPEGRPRGLAPMFNIIAPGTGHLWIGQATPVAYGLIAAAVAAYVLLFVNFWASLAVWVASAAFALGDLRDEVPLNENTISDVSPPWAWRIVAAGGALLIISLLLPWYRVSAEVEGTALSGLGAATNGNAFQSFELIDLLLLVVGVIGLAVGVLNVVQGTGGRSALPPQTTQILLGLAGLAAVLIAFRMIVHPFDVPDVPGTDFDIGRRPGVYVGLAASIAMAYAAAAAMLAERRT